MLAIQNIVVNRSLPEAKKGHIGSAVRKVSAFCLNRIDERLIAENHVHTNRDRPFSA